MKVDGRFPAEASPVYTVHEAAGVGANSKSIGFTVSDAIVRSCLRSTELGVANWASSLASLQVVDDWPNKQWL